MKKSPPWLIIFLLAAVLSILAFREMGYTRFEMRELQFAAIFWMLAALVGVFLLVLLLIAVAVFAIKIRTRFRYGPIPKELKQRLKQLSMEEMMVLQKEMQSLSLPPQERIRYIERYRDKRHS